MSVQLAAPSRTGPKPKVPTATNKEKRVKLHVLVAENHIDNNAAQITHKSVAGRVPARPQSLKMAHGYRAACTAEAGLDKLSASVPRLLQRPDQFLHSVSFLAVQLPKLIRNRSIDEARIKYRSHNPLVALDDEG